MKYYNYDNVSILLKLDSVTKILWIYSFIKICE